MRALTASRPEVERHLRSGRVGALRGASLLLEILLAYARVRWLMARKDIRAVLRELRAGVVDEWGDDDARRLGYRLARPVRRTLGPLPWDGRCLMQSLVLVQLLSRRNVRCDLVIGVRPGETFAAHAWVERAGRALLPPRGYARLTTL